MPRNIEIKARVPDLAMVRSKAFTIAGGPVATVRQKDVFFDVPRGRLKVRELADGSGELIAYEREDHAGPKESTYERIAFPDARSLVDVLAAVLPVRGTVMKRREVLLVGRTRIHLDQVERLGSFVELEVVMAADEPTDGGVREARALLAALGISQTALISGAYIDLLEAANLHDGVPTQRAAAGGDWKATETARDA
jgi:predicted adenylyl cyclase CyaB